MHWCPFLSGPYVPRRLCDLWYHRESICPRSHRSCQQTAQVHSIAQICNRISIGFGKSKYCLTLSAWSFRLNLSIILLLFPSGNWALSYSGILGHNKMEYCLCCLAGSYQHQLQAECLDLRCSWISSFDRACAECCNHYSLSFLHPYRIQWVFRLLRNCCSSQWLQRDRL